MAHSLPKSVLEAFSRFVELHVGLAFPPEKWPDLVRGIEAVAAELGVAEPETCVHSLMEGPVTDTEIELLARHLTVGETYFGREPLVFEVLRQRVLPELIASRREGERRLRFWSAACSTGEEPYTLATVLPEVLPEPENWAVTILATDINSDALRQAEEGVFTEWSFRAVHDDFKQRYFKPLGDGRYELLPAIRKMVRFAYLNLAQDVYPSLRNETNAMDVVFCRNVLMYFTQAQAKRIIAKLCHSLREGGWLVLSPGDAFSVAMPELVPLAESETALFQKCSKGAGTADRGLGTVGPVVTAGVEALSVESLEEARRLYESGRYAEALARLPSDPASPAVCRLLAQSLANQGRLAEALLWCEREVAMNPSNPDCHYLQATVLLEQGDGVRAVRELRHALCLDPDFVPAHLALGNLNRTRGKAEVARRHYRHALRTLSACPRDEAVPGADGMTAGRLSEMIGSLLKREPGA